MVQEGDGNDVVVGAALPSSGTGRWSRTQYLQATFTRIVRSGAGNSRTFGRPRKSLRIEATYEYF